VIETLPLDSVHVDLVLTDSAEAMEKRHEYLPLMSAEEHVRMGRLVFERDRHRFLLTRALVRKMLSRYAAVAPADWQFIANAYGRPELLDRPAAVPDLRFNISHTDGLIACAVTVGREVGVDVEYVGRHLTQDIAARFFAPAEVAHLKALPDPEQERVFFDFWTLKEAYIKARGFGLALPLGEFAFHLSPDGPPSISIEPSLDDDPATWQFLQDWPTPSHRLGLAIRRTGEDLPVRMRQIVP
jgi:4'-phosphopantetheinyl transferase